MQGRLKTAEDAIRKIDKGHRHMMLPAHPNGSHINADEETRLEAQPPLPGRSERPPPE